MMKVRAEGRRQEAEPPQSWTLRVHDGVKGDTVMKRGSLEEMENLLQILQRWTPLGVWSITRED